MAGAIILLVVVTLVVGIGINVYLRSLVQAESRLEAHLQNPQTHTVAYAVPIGVDPVIIRVELTRAGYHTGIGCVGDKECLRIECEPQQRERVRNVIEGVDMGSPDDLSALKVGHVLFEDER